jgi:hypothetical protein
MNFKSLKQFLLVNLLIINLLLSISCQRNVVYTMDKMVMKEQRIDSSKLCIMLPASYVIESETVKNEKNIYFLNPTDSVKVNGNIGLTITRTPVLYGAQNDSCKSVEKIGRIINRASVWKLYGCQGNFLAETVIDYDTAKIHAYATSSRKASLDTLISILETLRVKEIQQSKKKVLISF